MPTAKIEIDLNCAHGKPVYERCLLCEEAGRNFIPPDTALLTDIYMFLRLWKHEGQLQSLDNRIRFREECDKLLQRIEDVQGDLV